MSLLTLCDASSTTPPVYHPYFTLLKTTYTKSVILIKGETNTRTIISDNIAVKCLRKSFVRVLTLPSELSLLSFIIS